MMTSQIQTSQGKTSQTYKVRAFGPLACFTRPELKGERVSYEVMTPSAARGLLEAIYWKPAICWQVHEIAVLNPVRWTNFRRNEVNSKISLRTRQPYLADEDRAQRNTVALKDVDYVISASFSLTAKAGPDDNLGKHTSIFERRLKKGQCFQQPFFGCREMAASFESAPEKYQAIDAHVQRPLGLMLWDFDYPTPGDEPPGQRPPSRALFFNARLDGGVLRIPSLQEVTEQNRVNGEDAGRNASAGAGQGRAS